MAAGKSKSSDGELGAPLLLDGSGSPSPAPRDDGSVALEVGEEARWNSSDTIFRGEGGFHTDGYGSAPIIPPGSCNFGYSADEKCGRTAEKERSRDRARRSQNKRSLRNPIKQRSLVRRAAHSVAHEPLSFLKNLLWGLLLWPSWSWTAMVSQKSLTVLSLKSGVAAALASIICVVSFPEPYTELSSIATWAVVTIDILYEGNIGLSLSKGVNRVAGTFGAGALAIILAQLAPYIPEVVYPFYVVFWVFTGAFVLRFLRGIPPLKDQWGYAFTVATIAFHILLIGSFQQPEMVALPLLRLSMILLGFILASLLNLAIQPVYAGDSLHKLVAKNLDAAGSILCRCVKEYSNFTLLDHVPDILSGRSVDDKIHQSYHEIVMSDSDVDKLLTAVTWEPCHGEFFAGYPWQLYDEITDYLRYTLYDVIALDSCLRASIQAPKFLRDHFTQEMQDIAEECAKVLRILGDSMRNRRKFDSEDILRKAEEAALALQNKIYIHTSLLLGTGMKDTVKYSSYVGSDGKVGSRSDSALEQRSLADGGYGDYYPKHSSYPASVPEECDQLNGNRGDFRTSNVKQPQVTAAAEVGNGSLVGLARPVPIPVRQDATQEQRRNDHAKPLSSDGINRSHDGRDGEHAEITNSQENEIESVNSSAEYNPREFTLVSDSYPLQHSWRNSTENLERPAMRPSMEDRDGGPEGSQQVEENSLDDYGRRRNGVATKNDPAPRIVSGLRNLKIPGRPPQAWKQSFIKRKSSLGHNWEGSLERISALSLVKFASLLIEIVAKMKYVVASVENLSNLAKFQEIPE